jgi:hypothetical protein
MLKDIKQKSETTVSLSPTAIGHLEGLDTDEQRKKREYPPTRTPPTLATT